MQQNNVTGDHAFWGVAKRGIFVDSALLATFATNVYGRFNVSQSNADGLSRAQD